MSTLMFCWCKIWASQGALNQESFYLTPSSEKTWTVWASNLGKYLEWQLLFEKIQYLLLFVARFVLKYTLILLSVVIVEFCQSYVRNFDSPCSGVCATLHLSSDQSISPKNILYRVHASERKPWQLIKG